jgi:hypothetical protein
MSWGEPKALSPFPESSPFYGLAIPEDVTVESQVMAQPDPALSERTIASLTDGTPLVTRAPLGQGSVVLFHVTANADWSSLPLSGLFVQMLERLAVSTRPAMPEADDVAGITWVPEQVLDGFGTLRDAGIRPGVPGRDHGRPRPCRRSFFPASTRGGAAAGAQCRHGGDRAFAGDLAREHPGGGHGRGRGHGPHGGVPCRRAAALLADATGRALARRAAQRPDRSHGGRLAGRPLVLAAAPGMHSRRTAVGGDGLTPEDELALLATSEVTLAYVITGDPELDRTSQAGLQGLTNTLWARTSVEPAPPIGVNLETDELGFFPMLYWPVSPEQEMPSAEAYRRLNDYLRSGG